MDAVAAEAPCAVFAWGHCWSAARSDRLLAGLLSGVAQAALAECAAVRLVAHLLGSVWLNSPQAQPALLASVLLASRLVCMACLRQPVSVAGHPAAVSVLTRYSTHGGIGHPAAVSGLVTALVSLLAPQVGAVGAGILSPLPPLAAGLTWMLDVQGRLLATQQFLQRYSFGLLWRRGFAPTFGTLLSSAGLWVATGCARAGTVERMVFHRFAAAS